MSIYHAILGVSAPEPLPTKPKMFLYTVGIYTPHGRIVKQYYAFNRNEAIRDAYADGVTVVDCDMHPHD